MLASLLKPKNRSSLEVTRYNDQTENKTPNKDNNNKFHEEIKDNYYHQH